MERVLNFVNATLSVLEAVVIAVLASAALAVGTMQVVLRYVFNTGFSWSEAIFILLTITAMFAAGSRAVRDDAHVRVDLLPMLSPPPVRKALQVAAHLASLALCGYFVYAGLQYLLFAKMMETVSPDTGIADWVVYMIVPIFMAAFCLRYVIRIVRALQGRDVLVAHSVVGADTDHIGRRS